MYYLYGTKHGTNARLAATFSSQQQLLAYVRWATLAEAAGTYKFEQQSALAGFDGWKSSQDPLTQDDAGEVAHNPSPTML